MELCQSNFHNTYDWMNSCDNGDEFITKIYQTFSNWGFKGVAVGAIGEYSATLPRVCNYSEDYVDIYLKNNFLDHDHVMRHCSRQMTPINWRTTYAMNTLPKNSQNIIHVAESFDITHGMAVPVVGARGKGFVSLNFDGKGEEQEKYLQENLFHIMGACQAIYWALTSKFSDFFYEGPDLTPKELECLKFLSSGLSNIEIANLMSVSVNRIKELIKFIMDKLSVANRTEAVMHALRSGIIQ